MTVSVHNPDQYMASLRQIIAQGRKRIGLLVGAGAPAGTMQRIWCFPSTSNTTRRKRHHTPRSSTGCVDF